MKSFTKQSLTKRMMAIILSLLFAVSSFTIAGFVPTMDAQAGTGTLSVHSYGTYVNGSDNRLNSTRITICNDGGNNNFSAGIYRYDVSDLVDQNFTEASINANIKLLNQISSLYVDFYIVNGSIFTDLDSGASSGKACGTSWKNTSSDLVGDAALNQFKNYFGIVDSDKVYSFDHNTTGYTSSKNLTISDSSIANAINNCISNGSTKIALVVVMSNGTRGYTNGTGKWSDCDITNSPTLSYTCEDKVVDPYAPTSVKIFDGKTATYTTQTNENFIFTDSSSNMRLTGCRWGTTNANNSAGYITVSNGTINTKDTITGVEGKHWSVTLKAAPTNTTYTKATIFGLGSGVTKNKTAGHASPDVKKYADLFFLRTDGSVYFAGDSDRASTDKTVTCSSSSSPKTYVLTYDEGTVTLEIDKEKIAQRTVTGDTAELFESGVKAFFVGTSADNNGGGYWECAPHDNNEGGEGAGQAIYDYYLYSLSALVYPTTPDPVDPVDPDTDDSITRPDYSLLETAISNYEDVLATKLTSSNQQLVNAADGFKVYINAKAVLDKAKYGYGIDQSVVDDLTTRLNAAKNVLNLSASYFTSKAKDYKANYWSTPFNSSQNLNSPSDHYSNVAYTITDNNESSDALVRDYQGYQGRIKYVLPNNVCIYTGTNIMFPVMFGYTRNDHWYYHSFSSDVVNISLDEKWKWRNSTGSTDYAWQNNSPENAMSSSTSNTSTTYQSADGASNTVFKYYSNKMYMSPKNSTDALIKVTSLTSNVYLKVNQVNNYVIKQIKIGSGQDANFNFGIYILNYKYLTDTLSDKVITNKFSTKDDVLSLIQNTDVNDAAMLKYLTAYQDANNFIPYKVGGISTGSDISQSANYSTAWSTIEANATKMTGIINNLTDAYNALTKDTDYNTLRTYITQYADIDSNDQCYSNYANYKVARNTARAAISAAADKYLTDGTAVFNTKYDEVDIITIANNLKAERALVKAGEGEHLYKTQGILNKEDRTITYECFRVDTHKKYTVTDKAEAYISAVESLTKEMYTVGKYTDDSVRAAQSELNKNSFTSKQGSEKEEIMVDFPIDELIGDEDTKGILDTYTENILTALSELKVRTNLADVTIKYAYEKESGLIDIADSVNGIKTVNVKYGDLITDSGYTLAKDEHVAKWTIDDGERTTVLNYNPSTNINYEARKNATITCYIESEKETESKPYTVQFIDKAGRVRAIAYANDSTVFTVDANGVKADGQLVYEGDKLPYYQIRGFKYGTKECTTGSTFSVTGDTNIYTIYTASKPITITLKGDNNGAIGNKKINNIPNSTSNTYSADWDELITIEDTDGHGYYWYLNGVIAGKGSFIKFRANVDTDVTMKPAAEPLTTSDVNFRTTYGYNTDVSYFKYNEDLNRVTAVVNFAVFDRSFELDNSKVTEAGVILSTTASDAETIAKVGKKFASTKITDTGNQVHIAVSRTAKTEFTMYAIPYIIVDGDYENPCYGTNVKTIHYPELNA